MIILHDKDAIRELMDKNSLKTSGRPKLEFPSMCGFNYAVALRQYDDIWKKSRKLMHLQLGTPNSVRRYDGILDVEVAHLLQRVLDTPEDLFQHFGTYGNFPKPMIS